MTLTKLQEVPRWCGTQSGRIANGFTRKRMGNSVEDVNVVERLN